MPRRLPLDDASAAAIASNLPFGSTYVLPADPASWFAETLAELARIASDGAAVVLLVPASPAFTQALRGEASLVEERRLDIELLGKPTALWQLRRRART